MISDQELADRFVAERSADRNRDKNSVVSKPIPALEEYYKKNFPLHYKADKDEIIYYCTNFKCLVKLEPTSRKKNKVGEIEYKKFYGKYQCPNCKEIFVRSYEGVRSNSGIGATENYNEIQRLELDREQYLHDAKEIRKKLEFLDDWEQNRTEDGYES